jgi:DNA-binding IclR family transcriptional regulator
MPPDDRWLLIDVVAAEDVRVRVGPIGWVVLEAMVSLAPPGPVPVEVEYSARSLAGLVGVSKDKVARSLASIIVLGIVERVDHRHELSGRFLSTTYRVDLSTVGITVVGLHMPALVQSTSAPSRASVRTSASQLSLLS